MSRYIWSGIFHDDASADRFVGLFRQMVRDRYGAGNYKFDDLHALHGVCMVGMTGHPITDAAKTCAGLDESLWRMAIYTELCEWDGMTSYEDLKDLMRDWEWAKDKVILHMRVGGAHGIEPYGQDWTDEWRMSVCLMLDGDSHLCVARDVFNNTGKSIDEVLEQAYQNTVSRVTWETVDRFKNVHLVQSEDSYVSGILHRMPLLDVPYDKNGLLVAIPGEYGFLVGSMMSNPKDTFRDIVNITAAIYETNPQGVSNSVVWWRPDADVRLLVTDARPVGESASFKAAEGLAEFKAAGLLDDEGIEPV